VAIRRGRNHVSGKDDAFPGEQVKAEASGEHDGQTQVQIVGHEDEHKRETDELLEHVRHAQQNVRRGFEPVAVAWRQLASDQRRPRTGPLWLPTVRLALFLNRLVLVVEGADQFCDKIISPNTKPFVK